LTEEKNKVTYQIIMRNVPATRYHWIMDFKKRIHPQARNDDWVTFVHLFFEEYLKWGVSPQEAYTKALQRTREIIEKRIKGESE